ncbi:ubiquitin carboxyl-terminal hydrolase 40-like, partial [Pyxicephalus adspersus]|uniref:ubiquitin carboxyl-terminal hydrolase 40-like n=1 Tax=Pyxicephalus adspersus TaxID=30357 RepID=UPI003B59ABC7
MRPCKDTNSGSSQKYSESQRVFPSNFHLRDVQVKLAGSPSTESLLCSPSTENSEGWSVFALEDMDKTLNMLGLKDGSSLLLLDSHDEGETIFATENKPTEDLNLYCIQLQDWCTSAEKKKTVQVSADPNSVFLSFVLGTELHEGKEQEIILEETLTVKECLEQMLQMVNLQ